MNSVKSYFLLFNFFQAKHVHCLIAVDGGFFLLVKYMDTWSPACWTSADSGVHNESLDILDFVAFNGVRVCTAVLVTCMQENCWSKENKIHDLVHWRAFWSILLLRKPLEGDTNIAIKVKPTWVAEMGT